LNRTASGHQQNILSQIKLAAAGTFARLQIICNIERLDSMLKFFKMIYE